MFPQIFGKYVLEREIASGGMARVFLATLRGAGGFEKRLVVKQIRPELASDQAFVARFVEEAKTTVELSHANIVPVYELGVEQGTYYIAMEYCEGVSLNQLLSVGPVSPAEGAYVGVEICRALDYAHRRAGIIHRDVTPRNVMIDPEGMVRLIDFGIAASADASRSAGGAVFGSPGHMPPEQLRRGPLTPAADVFAVGALLHEAWTGRAPFRRDTFEASCAALEQPPPDVAAGAPALAPLSALISSALALDPRARPQTAEELARPLRDFLRQSDLGDIARRLGERVTQRLSLPSVPPPAPEARDAARSTTGVTQTFAVRDAVLEWTAKIATRPSRASLPAAAPDVEGAALALAPSSRAPAIQSARAARFWGVLGLATCMLAGVAFLARTPLPAPDSAASAAPRLGQPSLEAPLASSPREVAAAGVGRSTEPARLSADRLAEAPLPRGRTPRPESTRAARAPGLEAPKAATSGTPAHGMAPRAPARAPLPSARVDLTSEPRAIVSVDAAEIGRTPIQGLALPLGRHEVVFVNESLGERLETHVSLDGAEPRRVHADFTSATPRVYVR